MNFVLPGDQFSGQASEQQILDIMDSSIIKHNKKYLFASAGFIL